MFWRIIVPLCSEPSRSRRDCSTPKVKAVWSFQTSEILVQWHSMSHPRRFELLLLAFVSYCHPFLFYVPASLLPFWPSVYHPCVLRHPLIWSPATVYLPIIFLFFKNLTLVIFVFYSTRLISTAADKFYVYDFLSSISSSSFVWKY